MTTQRRSKFFVSGPFQLLMFTQALDRPSTHDFAMLEELSFVRREAQAEADLAYQDWRHLQSANAYAVYRAAQDRADAAQDDLARLSERIAA